MSAERLREAAAKIREGWEGVSPDYCDRFELAVADWLDEVAERQKPTTRWGRRSPRVDRREGGQRGRRRLPREPLVMRLLLAAACCLAIAAPTIAAFVRVSP